VKINRRGRKFSFQKRVPRKFADVEPRQVFYSPLNSKTEATARKEAEKIWAAQLDTWSKLLPSSSQDPFAEYNASRALAIKLGYSFLPAARVAQLPLDEFLSRVEATAVDGEPNIEMAKALLGGARRPPPTVDVVAYAYFSYHEDKVYQKSPEQSRLWRNARQRSIDFLRKAFGETPLDEVSTEENVEAAERLRARAIRGEIGFSAVNAIFAYADKILDNARSRHGYKIDVNFKGQRFTRVAHHRAPSFSTAWIRDLIIPATALRQLDPQARGVLLGMINTGYRLSEGANLLQDDIHLDCSVPYIAIQRRDRTLKTKYSRRDLPLVGVSLEAFRENPQGFPDYRDRSSLSQKLNRFLRANGLVETEKQTVRGLRHSLLDRLLETEANDRILRSIMGHKIPGPRYGGGPSLELKTKYLSAVAL